MSDNNKSNGPDCKRGPDCCCDPCYLSKIGCETADCCKCVPRTMCLKFTPDNPNECTEFSTLADWQGSLPRYQFGIGIYTIYISLENDFYGGVFRGNCYWRLTLIATYAPNNVVVLSETDYPIRYRHVACDEDPYDPYYDDDERTCASPSFVVTGFDPAFPISACDGVVTIERYEMERVPFRKREFDPPISQVPFYPAPCRDCDTVCLYICVRYNLPTVGLVQKDFTWDYVDRWRNGPDWILLVEDETTYDQCKLGFSIADLQIHGIVFPDTTVDTPCGVGLMFERFQSGNYISVTCNPCACWSRICGNCRCICKTLCVGRSDGSLNGTSYEELNWNDDLEGWTNIIGDYIVGLEKNELGGCQLRVPDYDFPFQVDGCGRGITASHGPDNDGKFVSINCKACTCARPTGCCGNVPLPFVLYADVTHQPYTVYDTAHVYECFSVLAVPLFYVPIFNPASPTELRWQGMSSPYLDDCGKESKVRVTVWCLAGGNGPYGEGTGGFGAFVEVIQVVSPGTLSIGQYSFPAIAVTDCSPLMIGDETWDHLGNASDPSNPTGSIGCNECSYGINLRVTE